MNAQNTLKRLSTLAGEKLPAALDSHGRSDNVGCDRRRVAVAQSIMQLVSWTPEELQLDLAELGAAYDACSYRTSSDPAVRNRQITCQQLRDLCREDGQPAQSALSLSYERAILVWQAWIGQCNSSDPRQAAMKATFERELACLREELKA